MSVLFVSYMPCVSGVVHGGGYENTQSKESPSSSTLAVEKEIQLHYARSGICPRGPKDESIPYLRRGQKQWCMVKGCRSVADESLLVSSETNIFPSTGLPTVRHSGFLGNW